MVDRRDERPILVPSCRVLPTTVSGAAANRIRGHDEWTRRRLHAVVNPQTAARARCTLAKTHNRHPGARSRHATLQVRHLRLTLRLISGPRVAGRRDRLRACSVQRRQPFGCLSRVTLAVSGRGEHREPSVRWTAELDVSPVDLGSPCPDQEKPRSGHSEREDGATPKRGEDRCIFAGFAPSISNCLHEGAGDEGRND
jgi:hypothetical protein